MRSALLRYKISGFFSSLLVRVGVYLTGSVEGLAAYAKSLREQARRSPLAEEIPAQLPAWHAPFATLYDLVRFARTVRFTKAPSRAI